MERRFDTDVFVQPLANFFFGGFALAEESVNFRKGIFEFFAFDVGAARNFVEIFKVQHFVRLFVGHCRFLPSLSKVVVNFGDNFAVAQSLSVARIAVRAARRT